MKKLVQSVVFLLSVAVTARAQTPSLTNERHIISPAGGQSSLADSRLSSVTGYLKIRLPQAWSNTTMKMTIDIFEYSTNRSRTLNLSGYNYESGGWYNVSANQQSSDDEAITVNFGYDGSKCAIYISKGTKGAATQWESPSVLVRDVIVSYSNTEVEKWSTGWQVGFTTTLGTNIQNLFVPSKSSLINERHIVSPVGGQSSLADSRLSSVTGYLKITLPQAWSNTTMKMTIDIFEYSTNRSRILNMSGYNYEAGGWYNVSANQQSSDDEAITVNFGYDGSKCAIYLSKGIKGAATQWEYPSVLVRDVVVSYSNIEAEKWNNGWQVGFTTTIGTNLLSIVASPSWQGISESTTGVVKVAGSVGIGTTSTPIGYKLAINGNAIANKIVVKQYPWADFVFKPEYQLPPLSKVEDFIKQKGHLPDIPSEAEVKENGIDLGNMDAKLLQKVEELTLYLIELKKENDVLKNDVQELKKAIKTEKK